MDLELLRTFLEVNRTRHFRRAADNLYVTPSAVSARVRQLEDALGVALFRRDRNDIHLTPDGERFLGHARNLVAAWERARDDVTGGAGGHAPIGIGVSPGAWEAVLIDAVGAMHSLCGRSGLRLQMLGNDVVAQHLLRQQVDLGLLSNPPLSQDLSARVIGRAELKMVAGVPDTAFMDALAGNYVMVDWGTAFAAFHENRVPPGWRPRVQVSNAHVALPLIMNTRGAAYLAPRQVTALVESGQLHYVADAPGFEFVAWAVWHEKCQKRALVESLVETLGAATAAASS